MRKFTAFLSLCMAGGLFLSGCATTSEPQASSDFEVEQVPIPEYREFLGELRVAVNDGIPREFNDREMERFEHLSDKLIALVDDHDSIEEMAPEHRRDLYNTHQELQALVSGKRDYQVICKRRSTVGTNFKTTECYTRREWREVSDHSRRVMEGIMRSPMTAPPGG